MILLPVSHEDATVRRMPWISITILAACVLMQFHACSVMPELEQRAEEITREMGALRRAVVSEQTSRRMGAKAPAPAAAGARGLTGEEGLDLPGDTLSASEWEVYAQTATDFDAGAFADASDPSMVRYRELQDELDTLSRQAPHIRFGYRPALDGLGSLLTAIFAHGGWLHLLGNMWFLYLIGCNLEDRWGRWQFASFYLVAGVIASLAFTALHPESEIPLVGASGAVAAAMGAFMVCYARTRVKLFYAYMLLAPRYGTFNASAWFVLLLWLLDQALMTLTEGSGAGVAFSAHVGGFVFGTAVAGMLRLSGVDADLDVASGRAAEADAEVYSEHALYLEAMALRDRGEDMAARQRLFALIAEVPGHLGAREALFNLGVERQDLESLDCSVRFLVDHYARAAADDAAVLLHRRLRRAQPSYGLTDHELLRVASAARRSDDAEVAIAAVTELMQQYPDSASMPRAMWIAAEVQARHANRELQRETLERITRRFPDHACAGMARQELARMEQELARMEAGA